MFEHLLGAGAVDAVQGAEAVELFARGQAFEERRGLQLDPHTAQELVLAFPRFGAVDRDGARLRFAQPLDHFERCGLAGAVGSENPEEFPLLDLERHSVDGPKVPIRHDQAIGLDCCPHASDPNASGRPFASVEGAEIRGQSAAGLDVCSEVLERHE